MKLTVGPLPPAVYWRRRGVLLVGLLVVVLLSTSLCSTSSSGKVHSSAQTVGSPGPSATATVLTPTTGNPNDAPTSPPPPVVASATSAQPPVAPTQTGPCTDAEISVVAAPVSTTVKTGVPLKIFLKVKNVSNRVCSREVGADAQELAIQQNKAKVWSSDDCAPLHGSDMKSFGPGIEVSFFVIWDAKSSAAGCDKRAFLAPGAYQIVARLTARYSDPVNLTVQA